MTLKSAVRKVPLKKCRFKKETLPLKSTVRKVPLKKFLVMPSAGVVVILGAVDENNPKYKIWNKLRIIVT